MAVCVRRVPDRLTVSAKHVCDTIPNCLEEQQRGCVASGRRDTVIGTENIGREGTIRVQMTTFAGHRLGCSTGLLCSGAV